MKGKTAKAYGLACVCGVAVWVILLLWLSTQVGTTWDEPAYKDAGDRYVEWISITLGPGVVASTSPFKEVRIEAVRGKVIPYQNYIPMVAHDFIVVNNRRGYFNEAIRILYDQGDPRYELLDEVRLLGVSLLKVFRRRGLSEETFLDSAGSRSPATHEVSILGTRDS